MPRLAVYKGPSFQAEYSFPGQDLILIGRALANDVVLESHNASRQHVALVPSPQRDPQYFVRDLGSLHGTRIGGQAVDRRLLRDGDVIQIANYRLVYSSHSQPSNQPGLLRVVPRRLDAGLSQLTTWALASPEPTAGATFTPEMRELMEHFEKRARSNVVLSALLHENAAAVLQLLRADRGFIRLLGDGPDSLDEDVAVIGLESGAGIEISNGAFMDYLLQGKCLREATTLLAPIIAQEKVVGFFCLDRRPPAEPFRDADGQFLIALARCAAADPSGDLDVSQPPESERALEWGPRMVAKSKKMQELLRAIRDAAAKDANVLLIGQTGTGKELVARALHEHSSRSNAPFIARDCRQTTESLAETEIFGYVPKSGIAGANPDGAPGWFELANNGTLFLDEIQSLSPSMQDMFLRALQEHEVRRYGARQPIPIHVRVVAASSDVQLERALERGDFRTPLYHRFASKLPLPSLRERPEDIPLLAFFFLDRYAARFGAKTRSISRRAIQKLTDYDWPGNVRELENQIKQAISNEKEVLFSWDFHMDALESPLPDKDQTAIDLASRDIGLKTPARQPACKTMEEIEKEKIMEALEATQGNVTKASELLGYKSRQTILNKMDRYRIPRDYGDFSEPRL
jgi:DNA-binding NtrC family response regulator